LDDLTPDEDCGVPIDKGLPSLRLCTGLEEVVFSVGTSAPMHQGHQPQRRHPAKAEVCGRRRGPSSPRGLPSCLRGGRDGAHV
jgi:hypothetical protein